MSIHSAVDFWRHVQTNPELSSKLSALIEQANDDAYGAGAQMARESGFHVTPEEMKDVGGVVNFWKRVEHDEALRRALEPARECETADLAMREIMKVAGAAGFEFPVDALQYVTAELVNAGPATTAPAEDAGMTDGELAGVAGGAAATLEADQEKLDGLVNREGLLDLGIGKKNFFKL